MTKVLSKTIDIELSRPKGREIVQLSIHYKESLGWFGSFQKRAGAFGKEGYVFTNNMVFLAPFTFLKIMDKLPKKEYSHGGEQKMIESIGKMKEKDFLKMIKKCVRANKRVGWIDMSELPYEIVLNLFDEKFEDTPSDILMKSIGKLR